MKTKKIVGWIISGLLGLMLCASAIDKITGFQHALQMASSFGIPPETYSELVNT